MKAHQSYLDNQEAQMEDKGYKCQYSGCQFSTKHKWSLQRHDLVHTKVKNFPCSLCEYRAAAKFRLTKHMRTHSTDKSTATASTSKYSASQASSHSSSGGKSTPYEERRFDCHLCKYKGKTQSHLSRHLVMKDHNIPDKGQPIPDTEHEIFTINSQVVHPGGVSDGTVSAFSTSTLDPAFFKFSVPSSSYTYGSGINMLDAYTNQ